jgi:hypothetical protein
LSSVAFFAGKKELELPNSANVVIMSGPGVAKSGQATRKSQGGVAVDRETGQTGDLLVCGSVVCGKGTKVGWVDECKQPLQ